MEWLRFHFDWYPSASSIQQIGMLCRYVHSCESSFAVCRWWKVWQLWQRRKPRFGMNREELATLDAELPLDEALHFRLRTAMRHSYLLQSREYANTVIRILNTIAVNAHSPLPRNTEAIIKGEPVSMPDNPAVAHD